MGMPKRRIAREVGVSVRTIQRWGGAVLPPPSRGGPEEEPARRRPGGWSSPTLQPYAAYLQERWAAGCSNVSQLYREVCTRGDAGSYTLLAQALRSWRPSRPPPKQRRQAKVRWLCLRPRAQLREEERQALDRLVEHEPALGCGYGLLHRFRALIAARDVEALDGWLTDAQQSELPSFIALANGIRGDLAAVEAALTTSWSTGPVEGHIHRLKLIKRQGYGRAKLDLLRRRVVAA
jgi:transposase